MCPLSDPPLVLRSQKGPGLELGLQRPWLVSTCTKMKLLHCGLSKAIPGSTSELRSLPSPQPPTCQHLLCQVPPPRALGLHRSQQPMASPWEGRREGQVSAVDGLNHPEQSFWNWAVGISLFPPVEDCSTLVPPGFWGQ